MTHAVHVWTHVCMRAHAHAHTHTHTHTHTRMYTIHIARAARMRRLLGWCPMGYGCHPRAHTHTHNPYMHIVFIHACVDMGMVRCGCMHGMHGMMRMMRMMHVWTGVTHVCMQAHACMHTVHAHTQSIYAYVFTCNAYVFTCIYCAHVCMV